MIDWPALHRAVVEDLDSDEPRLVLADALQAAGDPRGELIAVQCELARLGCERTRLARGLDRKVPGEQLADREWMADVFAIGDYQRRAELRATEKRLLADHVDTWTAGLPEGCRIERGFVEHVDAYQLRDPAVLFDRAPVLESLEVELSTNGAELMAEPRMQQVKQLRIVLSGPVPDRAALAQWLSELPRLCTLSPDDDSSDREFEWCFPPAVVERLEAVALARPAPDLVRRLCETARRLRHLSLRAANTAALEAAADRLEILELDQTRPQFAAVAPSFRALRVLRLFVPGSRRVDGPGRLEDVARAIGGNLPALQLLDVSHTAFGRSLPQLFVGGGLASLTHLRLRGCGAMDETLAPLLSSPLRHQLQHLDLRNNPITDRSVAGLSTASSLRVLELHGTNLSPSGLDALRANLPDARLHGPVFR